MYSAFIYFMLVWCAAVRIYKTDEAVVLSRLELTSLQLIKRINETAAAMHAAPTIDFLISIFAAVCMS